MPTHYIRMDKDSNPLFHTSATDLPYNSDGSPKFLTVPRGNKQWYKAANISEPPLAPGERYGPVNYSGLGDDEALIEVTIIPKAAPVIAPIAPTEATNIAEVLVLANGLRQRLIDLGFYST